MLLFGVCSKKEKMPPIIIVDVVNCRTHFDFRDVKMWEKNVHLRINEI